MGVNTERYIRKPLYVDAVRVTASNFDEIAAWCQGEIQTDEVPGTGTTKKYIKVRVHNPKGTRQTQAFIGDWLLYTDRGYKVYTNKAFRTAFDRVETEKFPDLDEPPSEDEEIAVAAKEERASAEEIREKLPQAQDRRKPTQKAEEIQEQTPPETALYTGNEPVAEGLKEHGATTGADPEFEGSVSQTRPIDHVTIDSVSVVSEEPVPGSGVQPIQSVSPTTPPQDEEKTLPVDAAHHTPQGEPHEYIEATPQAIADAVSGEQPIAEFVDESEKARSENTGIGGGITPEYPEDNTMGSTPREEINVSEQTPEVKSDKRVLSEEEQRQMGPDAVREMVRSGDVILAQDLAA